MSRKHQQIPIPDKTARQQTENFQEEMKHQPSGEHVFHCHCCGERFDTETEFGAHRAECRPKEG